MQDQAQHPATKDGQFIAEKIGAEGLAPGLLEKIRAADAIVLVVATENGTGPLEMRSVILGGQFAPGSHKAHAYINALYQEHPNIVRRVFGDVTDSQRFHALRDLAVLANQGGERFTKISEMILKFETESSIPEEGKRTAEDFELFADFLVLAMHETAPLVVEAAPAPN